jgi:hypothetical protein
MPLNARDHDAFLALPPGLEGACAEGWRMFASDPTRSRRLADEAFAARARAGPRAWAGLCLAYQQVRAGETQDAAGTLDEVRGLLRKARDARGKALADVIGAYVDVARGEPDAAASALLTPESLDALTKAHAGLAALAKWDAGSVEATIRDVAESAGLKLGKLAQPLRAALTGRTTSPGIFDVLVLLGRDESLGRIADRIGAD